MIKVYQLRLSKEMIQQVQHATLTTWTGGIAKTHGLFGSEEWWENIASGRLQKRTVAGVITQLSDGPYGDWPEFTMSSESGKDMTFSRFANGKVLSAAYAVGRHVEVDYVLQRDRLFGHGSFFRRHKQVIEVRIKEDAQQTAAASPVVGK